MLAALGLASLDELLDQAVPASIRDDKPLELDDAVSEPEAIARLRALADRNQVLTSLIGQGYYGTHTPGRDPAQRAGEPGLVHGLHALPARDQPGPARGAAQLPDHGLRPHGHGDRQRLDARRGHRRRRGDDAGPPVDAATRATCSSSTPSATRRPSPWWPPGPSRWASRWWSATRPPTSSPADGLRRAAAAPGHVGRGARPAPGHRGGPRGRRPGRRGHRPAGLHAAGAARRAGRRRRRGLVPALRRAHGLRRPARGLPGHPRRLPPLAARPPGRRVGRRRRPPRAPAGAADPRAAHPPGEGHLQHLHGPGAAGGDGVDVRRVPRARGPAIDRPAGRTRRRRASATALGAAGFEACQRHLVRHADACAPRARRPRWSSGPATAGINLRRVDADTLGLSLDETTDRSVLGRLATVFGLDGDAWRDVPIDGDLCGGPPTARSPASPRASGAAASSSPTRCSTSTTPRPRCCATCAAWPTRTWPSTER